MLKTRTIAIAAGAVAAAGFVAAPFANAGHENTVLTAALDGRAEVATDASNMRIVGDRDGDGEAYVFGIDGDPSTLCYVLIVEDIAELDQAPLAGTRMAHIHAGATGENGPVEVNLAWPQDGQAADCLTEGEAGKGLTAGEVRAILDDPDGYYVNVHNGEHPSGAIRGQLEAQHSH